MTTILYIHDSFSGFAAIQSRRLAGLFREGRKLGWDICEAALDPSDADVGRTLSFWRPAGCVVEGSLARTGRFLPDAFAPVPVVYFDTERDFFPDAVDEVRFDSDEIARAAARELLSLGLPHYAYAGYYIPRDWSRRRGEVFAAEIRARGLPCHVFETSGADPLGASLPEVLAQLRGFVQSLPRPCGLLGANDEMGGFALKAARQCGIGVPSELAIVGIDNDELRCENADPTLSSFLPDFEGSGEIAARLLAGRMAEPNAPVRCERFGLKRFVPRQSTHVLRTDDPCVARGVERIRRGLAEGIRATDVARAMGLGLRTAQKRFLAASGHTIAEEILARRLVRARELLAGTTLVTAPWQLGAEGGTVRKASDATLQLRGSQVLVRGKRMLLAGSVTSSDTTSSWGNGLLTDCDLVLQGDLTWTESNTHLAFARRCALDMSGNKLTLTAKEYCLSQLYDTIVTNSSATAGKISTSWNRQLRIGDGTELWGGAQNTVEAPSGNNANAAFIFVGKAKGDWTIKPGISQGSNPSGVRAGQASAANVPGYGYDGPLVISGNTKFNFSQANGCLTFGGKVSGSGTIDVRGGIVNFNGTGHTFSGTVTLTNETSTTLPAAICVGPGAALPGTSARIDAGTLSFAGAQPVTAPLVFAADTTLDMNGEDLTVADMTGFPTVANPARLTITGVWTVTCDDLLGGAALDLGAGELAFGPSASIHVVDRTPALMYCVVARASGGISGLPSVTGWKADVSVSGGELRLSVPGTVLFLR